ncbi:MAG: flagellar biosynthesis protein FliQ [Pseudomonadales bacterium]|nr:flagellar biosynthesis protein FliQ [Pseudomonadales bacterium]
MTPHVVLDIFKEALMLIVLMVSVIVVPSLMVGLVVSMFQAATQINEQTLSFLPRLLVTLGTIMMLGPWLLNLLMEHANSLLVRVPLLIG